jgi:tetratricopeptide (TPR) repeat protein/DNA-binding winged helix-turn-helix (wHTH) protein
MTSERIRYRFGLFEVDVHAGSLFKQGRIVRIQEQPFRVLVALLERHGDVILREELRARLWPDDTFVEFDKSLGVALAKVRAALGDDAANPRFVETIPKRGYRFIAPVTVVAAEPAAASDPVRSDPATAPAEVPPSRSRSPRTLLVASAVVVMAAAAALFLWRARATEPLTSPIGIVIGNFTNSTGDSVFDGSLRRAAVMGLAQSPYLRVLSDGSVGQILQGLGRPPDEPLTSGLAREVCRRASAAATVNGSIDRSGRDYVLTIEATRCGDGILVAQKRVSVGNRDQIVAALGRAIAELRRRLGEPDSTLQSYNVPVDVATTDSLEALRAYQLGMELRARGDNLKAIPALKTAIALDTRFAVAYAQLGSSYSNMGNANEATPFFRKAFELRDRATAPERFLIAGRYFDIVIGDLEKASETYRAWTQVYPDEWLGFNALANDANLMGRYDVAENASRRTVSLEPNRVFGYTNLATALVGSKRYDEGKAVCRKALEHFPDGGSAHVVLYALAAHEGDSAGMAREEAWSNAHPDRSEILFEQAEWAASRGRPVEAGRMFDEVARRERAAGNPESPADSLVNGAEYLALMGRTDAAMTAADEALRIAHNEVVLGLGALVYAVGGRDDVAEKLLQEAAERHPLSTMTMGVYGPTAKGVLIGNTRGATLASVADALAPGVPYEWGQEAALAPSYIRGLEYLRLHAWTEAAQAFQAVIDHEGVDPVSPVGPLAYLGLARADAALGRREESRHAYETVLRLWRDAEPDFALVKAARREVLRCADRRGVRVIGFSYGCCEGPGPLHRERRRRRARVLLPASRVSRRHAPVARLRHALARRSPPCPERAESERGGRSVHARRHETDSRRMESLRHRGCRSRIDRATASLGWRAFPERDRDRCWRQTDHRRGPVRQSRGAVRADAAGGQARHAIVTRRAQSVSFGTSSSNPGKVCPV